MVLDRNKDISLFGQLKNILIKQIDEAEYQPGDMLPSETELITKYSISRTTARKAAQALVQEGFAYTVHGKGTFVIETGLTQYLNNLTSFSHDVKQRGMTPGRKILSLERCIPDKKIAAKLRIPPSDEVFRIERLLLADKQPVSIGRSYIPLPSVAPNQGKFSLDVLNDVGLYALLESIGITLSFGEQVVSAVSANSEQALLLNVENNSPLLYSERLSFTDPSIPIEFSEMGGGADKTRWRIVLGPYDSK